MRTKNNGLIAVDSVRLAEPYLDGKSASIMVEVRFGPYWWTIRGSNSTFAFLKNRCER